MFSKTVREQPINASFNLTSVRCAKVRLKKIDKIISLKYFFRRNKIMNVLLFHIVYCSVTIALLFGGYSMISEYMTILYGDIGFYAYFIIYLFNVVGSIIAPFIAFNVLGIKWSIFVGAITYFIWMTVFNSKSAALLLGMSVINGIGSGLMRSQQSVWITSLPIQDRLGYYTGIYNAIFNFNGIFAAIISIIFLFFKFELDVLIWIFVLIGFVSIIMLIFIKPVPLNREHYIDMHSFYIMLKDKTFLLLYPVIIFQSVSMIFTYAIVPIFMKNNDLAIAIMFLIYSIFSAIIAYITGVLCDRVRTTKLVIIICINSIISMFYIFMIKAVEFQKDMDLSFAYIVVGIFCAVNDFGINGILVYILSKLYTNKAVFSIHRAVYSIFCAIYAAIAPFILWYINVMLCVPLIIIGYYCFRIYLNEMEKYNNDEDKNLVLNASSGVNDKSMVEKKEIEMVSLDP